MFTGIIEEVAEVMAVNDSGTNRTLTLRARMTPELRVDQSVSHSGVCLTVVHIDGDRYDVVAVKETLDRTNLDELQVGHRVYLERSLRIGDRLDGHMVQGHVDRMVRCIDVKDENGSWRFAFDLPEERHLLVQKGSVCLNGVSLTIASLTDDAFSVAIIPYTFE
ncbi:MAG TPA: riboflavin synthase, partial [Flavobacteriales bacterium]|nr:riboflavin synthase [Flavobacteriales bacterium]